MIIIYKSLSSWKKSRSHEGVQTPWSYDIKQPEMGSKHRVYYEEKISAGFGC